MSDNTVVVADAYPNFSINGIAYNISGEVTHWRNLAHRTLVPPAKFNANYEVVADPGWQPHAAR